MKIPAAATSYCPPVVPISASCFRGAILRHTVRPLGTRDWLLIYTLGGSGLYRFPGGTFESRPRDITLFRPGAFQDYQISPRAGRWDIFFAHFLPRPEWLPWLNWPEKSPGLMTLPLREAALGRRVVRRFQDMIRFQSGAHARWQTFGLNAMEEVLLWCDSVNPNQATTKSDPRIGRALEHLTSHVAEPFSEEKLARTAGLSPSRLRHLFRQETGESPRQFQEQLRLLRARDLLAMSRQTIGEISQELGFSNPFYFTLRFKKQTGESPRAFRQRITGASDGARVTPPAKRQTVPRPAYKRKSTG